jgi:hypothetical protein
MSERYFRIIVGLWLITGLFLGLMEVIYALTAVLLFEGVTNQRVPALVSRLRYGRDWSNPELSSQESRFSFEAERALRFIVVVFVIVSQQPGFEILWWLPWFLGFAFIGAGLSGICPMVMALRYVGLK